MNLTKIKEYLLLSRKAGYLLIGGDNVINHRNKLYLVVTGKNSSDKSHAVASRVSEETNAVILNLEDVDISQLVCINNCQIVGVKNKGLSDMIIKNYKEEV